METRGNPNFKQKWKTKPTGTIRVPEDYHDLLKAIAQALDDGKISKSQLRMWLNENAYPDKHQALQELKNILG